MEYFRGIFNSIGIKIFDKSDGEGVVSLVKKLNLDNVLGCIIFIFCMGVVKLCEYFLCFIIVIEDVGFNVLWVTDFMYGNIIKIDNGFKMCLFEVVCDEIMVFFEVYEKMGIYFGGVYLEMMG